MGFQGLRVVSVESRRAELVRRLVEDEGGFCFNAPSLRERPIEDNPAAIAFAERLIAGEYDAVFFNTGVGTGFLLDVVRARDVLEPFLEALGKVQVIVRGPKPTAALRPYRVPIAVHVPEPNTWREALEVMPPVEGRRIAVQEYGVPNNELLEELRRRGGQVEAVPVYRWDLPEDLAPLKEAARRIAAAECDAAMFFSSIQIVHLLQAAESPQQREAIVESMRSRLAVASIGPVTTEALEGAGVEPDFAPDHPKMAICIRQFAEAAPDLLARKRQAALASGRG